MINRETVIKMLDYCSSTDSCDGCPYDHLGGKCFRELARNALDLLKEQEPLEPTRVEIEQVGPLYHRCYCPKCGHHVGNMINNKVADVHENFCSSCGQAIKWR